MQRGDKAVAKTETFGEYTYRPLPLQDPLLPLPGGLANFREIQDFSRLGEYPYQDSTRQGALQYYTNMVGSPMAKGSTITFHDISYEVEVQAGDSPCCGKKQKKRILKNVNGIFKPGMNAILGPTGSGKTSLLDVLAGRKDPQGLSGLLLVDGKKQPGNFKCMTGYVVQDDVVMGTLTVRENLMFSANLRLPKHMGHKEKSQRVNDTIHELGLSEVADDKCGNEFIRGISGGERKRTNIGMELIISPAILFLDEPTTGLDCQLARKGRTIIFSIHQPRYTIYKLFDRMMLLALGNTVYHGPAVEALDYFSSIGFECEEHNNPPDFFLDVINGDSTAVTSATEDAENQGGGHAESANDIEAGLCNLKTVSEEDVATTLAHKYEKSQWCEKVNQELAPIQDSFKKIGTTTEVVRGQYAVSWLTQFTVVSKRTVLNNIRNPMTSILQVIVMVLFAVIVGLIYLQIDNSLKSGIQNRVGAFFFIVMNQVFGNLSAVELFIQERAIFIHENASGFYTVSAYFVAKLACDIIPMRAIPVSAFAGIVYFMIGFQAKVDKFFFFLLNVILTTLAAAGMGFLVSASVKIFAIANLLLALTFVFMMVFGGLLVNLDTIVKWLQWLKYFSLFRYSINGLSINEMKDFPFCTTVNGTEICDPTAGNRYLEQQGIPYKETWDLWVNEVALGSMVVILWILSYIQMRRIKKLK